MCSHFKSFINTYIYIPSSFQTYFFFLLKSDILKFSKFTLLKHTWKRVLLSLHSNCVFNNVHSFISRYFFSFWIATNHKCWLFLFCLILFVGIYIYIILSKNVLSHEEKNSWDKPYVTFCLLFAGYFISRNTWIVNETKMKTATFLLNH